MPLPTNNWRQLLAEATRLMSIGQFRPAEPLFRAVLSVRPRECEALQGLGTICAHTNRLEEAVALLQQALSLKPGFAEAHATVAFAMMRLHQAEEARQSFRTALALKPGAAPLHANYGSFLAATGDLPGAVAAFEQAIALNPNHPDAHFNLANVQRDLGRSQNAIAGYRRAIELHPHYGEALHNLGFLLRQMAQLDEALAMFRRALAITPPFTQSLSGIASVLFDLGKATEAVSMFQEHLRIHPRDPVVHSSMLYAMEGMAEQSPQTIHAAYVAWGKMYDNGEERFRTYANRPDPERRIRIGYCSSDFRMHSVSHFLEPLLAHHDPAHVEVFCYSDVRMPDAVTERFEKLSHGWRRIAGLSDAALASLVHEDQIDIFVDLGGHTAGNRLLAFARKPAPIQVTYLGYPATTGLGAMDYRMTDAFTDPPEESDAWCTERLIRLPQTFLCYQPPGDAPPVRLEREPGRPITFCSFNAMSKVNTRAIALWSRVLEAVPDSRMIFKARALRAPSARQALIEAFTRHGISADRLSLNAFIDSRNSHLDLYNDTDVALDTFPYNGTTTTCEALWMGVPVVTLAGVRHAGRVGVSLLSNIGLPELIAERADGYVQVAAELARDAERRARLRSGLRDRMRASPLMQAEAFARHVEEAYRAIWRRWCVEQPGS